MNVGMRKLHKKDGRIELLRVIACFFVIVIHIMKPDVINDEINDCHLIVHTIIGDAVSIFFAITGCFLYRSNSMRWGYKWTNYLINILIPAFLIGNGITMLMPILNSETMPATFKLAMPNLKDMMKGLLFFQPNIWASPCSIYWYVFEYVKLLVFYPVCYLISKNKQIEKITVGLCVLSVLIGDVNHFLNTSVFGNISLLPAAVTFSLMGDWLYSQNRDDGGKRKEMFILGLVATIAIRFILQRWAYNTIGSGETTLVYWNHFFSFLIVYFALRMVLCFKQDKCGGKIIRVIGENSFYIYLLHIIFVWRIKKSAALYDRLTNGTGILYILQIAAIVMMILLISLLAAIPLRVFHRKWAGIVMHRWNHRLNTP